MKNEGMEWILMGAAILAVLKPVLDALKKLLKTLFRGRDLISEHEDQTRLINELRQETEQRFLEVQEKHDAAVREIKGEQSLIIFGNLACLKGLEEQGCDGPVHEAIERIEDYLNRKAHS